MSTKKRKTAKKYAGLNEAVNGVTYTAIVKTETSRFKGCASIVVLCIVVVYILPEKFIL